jgi:hypothetical protein
MERSRIPVHVRQPRRPEELIDLAAFYLGGTERVAARLGVQRHTLEAWRSGTISTAYRLQLLELLVELQERLLLTQLERRTGTESVT